MTLDEFNALQPGQIVRYDDDLSGEWYIVKITDIRFGCMFTVMLMTNIRFYPIGCSAIEPDSILHDGWSLIE